MFKSAIVFSFLVLQNLALFAAQNEFSIVSWKFDMPSALEDYNAVYENRAKTGLKEVNMFSDADILCLQGLALSMQDVQNLLGCYNLVSYANGCCILVKKYAKHFIPLYKTAFLHGTSVLLQAQDAIDLKLHICSIDCHEKKDHEGCIILREEKPALYLGTGIYTHPIFSKMKLLGTIKSKEDVQGVAFDIQEGKENNCDIVVKLGLNKEGRMPSKSIASSEPLYNTVLWKGFHRVSPENNAYTAFSKNHRVALKSEPLHTHQDQQDWKKTERLPHGIAVQVEDKPVSCMEKNLMLGKPIEIYTPNRLRRLYENEFTVIFWNLGNAQATKEDRQQALLELTYFGADIVALQGLQGLLIDSLLPYYTIAQHTAYGALLIHKRSSLLHKDAQVIMPLQGLGCTIYDSECPNDEIIVYCLDLANDASLYTHNLKVRPYNSLVMGTNLQANKLSFADALKDHSLYHAIGQDSNQILVTGFPHKVKLLLAKTFWNDTFVQLYSGVGMLTKYGKTSQAKTVSKPLFATFEWDGIRRYKMDIPLQKMPQTKAKSD